MSALSNCVTCGIVVPGVAEMLRRRAADVAPRLALDLAPLLEVGQRPRRRAARRAPRRAPAEPTLLRIRRACSLTSSCEMRPPGPVPCTSLMSTPISRARRRTDGDAGAAGRARRPAGAERRGCAGGCGRRACRTASARPRVDRRCLACWSRGGCRARLRQVLRRRWPARRRRVGSLRRGCAACAVAEPVSSTVSTTAPTLTLSPFLTLISLTTPATEDGTSMVALSVSSSRTG